MNTDKTNVWLSSGFICVYLCSSVVALFAHDPITTKVTWNKEVVRILTQRCLGCHREGGVAPMSLATYAEARPWAKAIKEEVLEQRMPPWHAAKGFGDFFNDRALTMLEKELLVDWVEGGAPKGDDKDLPKPTPGALTGKPDATSATVSKTAQWITGWEFHPASGAVEQAEFWMVAGGQRSYVGNWVPPEGRTNLPDDVGILFPAGARIVIEAHFRPGEEAPSPSGILDLYFAKKPPAHRMEYRRMACGSSPLNGGMRLLAVRPLASLEMTARLPDGQVEPLGLFREGKQVFKLTYRYRQPVALPRGASIDLRSAEGAASCAVEVSYIAVDSARATATRKHAE
jgi:hypothetical protein